MPTSLPAALSGSALHVLLLLFLWGGGGRFIRGCLNYSMRSHVRVRYIVQQAREFGWAVHHMHIESKE